MKKIILLLFLVTHLSSNLHARSGDAEERIVVGLISSLIFFGIITLYNKMKGERTEERNVQITKKVGNNNTTKSMSYVSYSSIEYKAVNSLFNIFETGSSKKETCIISIEYLPMDQGVKFEYLDLERSNDDIKDLLEFEYTLASKDGINRLVDEIVSNYNDEILKEYSKMEHSGKLKYYVNGDIFNFVLQNKYMITLFVNRFKNGTKNLEERIESNENLSLNDIAILSISGQSIEGNENFDNSRILEGNTRLNGVWKVVDLLVSFRDKCLSHKK